MTLLAVPAAAQIVLNADGSLPAPSVSSTDYPAMLECTLAKRGPDIEALLQARDEHWEAHRAKGLTFKEPISYDGVMVRTIDGKSVEEPRLAVQIVETCHKLKEGYPLGFWTESLYRDWATALSFGAWARNLDDIEFAACLAKNRPELVARYLGTDAKSEPARMTYRAFFSQRVCTPLFPAGIKQKRVRKQLLRSGVHPRA